MITKIISGGQTGVDRAALDVAMELELPCGGWCPQGRRSEDGRIPDRYPLTELDSRDYALRTEKNVVDSDGTLILANGELEGGTALTAKLARNHNKLVWIVNLNEPINGEELRQRIESSGVQILNVAGPRESNAPGIYDSACQYLRSVLRRNSL